MNQPRPASLASVGPPVDQRVGSCVIPDPEFYNVGRSVSGFFNFGGIRSIRPGRISLASATGPTLSTNNPCVKAAGSAGIASNASLRAGRKQIGAIVLDISDSDDEEDEDEVPQKDALQGVGGGGKRRWVLRVAMALLVVSAAIAVLAATVSPGSSDSAEMDPAPIATPAPGPEPSPGPSPSPAPAPTPGAEPTSSPTVAALATLKAERFRPEDTRTTRCTGGLCSVQQDVQGDITNLGGLSVELVSATDCEVMYKANENSDPVRFGIAKLVAEDKALASQETKTMEFELELEKMGETFFRDTVEPALEDCANENHSRLFMNLHVKLKGGAEHLIVTNMPCGPFENGGGIGLPIDLVISGRR